jgi:hypothetical protein
MTTIWRTFVMELTAAFALAAAPACTPPLEESEAAADVQSAVVDATGKVGAVCDSAHDCGKNEMCTDSGRCACDPDLVACGKQCVDLANDPKHCGTCAVKFGRKSHRAALPRRCT